MSRPLFFYVKKAHIGVIPGLKEFAEFFVSDDVAGPDGPLADYGLVSDPELAATQAQVADERDAAPADVTCASTEAGAGARRPSGSAEIAMPLGWLLPSSC